MGAGGGPPRRRRAPRLGDSRKAGDLKRLAGACCNGGACGLIRQYPGHLTRRRGGLRPRSHAAEAGPPPGAAWLSSVRAVRCGLGSPNERNPPGGGGAGPAGAPAAPPSRPRRQKSSQYGLDRRGHTRATRGGATGRLGDSLREPPTPPPVPTARRTPCAKPKPLVIAHQPVAVKSDQALHTPPITLGERGGRAAQAPRGGAGRDGRPGDRSEVDTR